MLPPTVSPRELPAGPVADLPAGVPATYDVPDVGPLRLLDDAVRDFPDGVAVRTGDVTLTWTRLAEVVNEVAAGLHGAGVGPGTVVAVSAAHDVRDVVVPLAVWRCRGVLAVPGSGIGADGSPIAHVVVDHDPHAASAGRVVVEVTARRASRLRPWRRQATVTTSVSVDGEQVVQADEGRIGATATGPGPASTPALVTHDRDGGRLSVPGRSLVAAAFALRLWVPDVQAGEEVMLLQGLRHRDVSLTLVPALLAAATIVVGDRADPLAAAVANEVTLLVADATAVTTVPRDTGTALRVLLHHGPLPESLVHDLRERTGARICQIAGAPAANHLTHARPVYGRSDADGRALAVTNTCSVVVDEDGDPVREGAVGRLFVAGPQVAADGWLDTGVTVRLGPGGSLLAAT